MKNSVLIGQILSVNFMATKIKINKMITTIKVSVTSYIFFINAIFSTNFHWLFFSRESGLS